jgi:Fe-S-cluster containining protein
VNIPQFLKLAGRKASGNRIFLSGLKKKNTTKVDEGFHSLHREVFEEISCLTCGNCCKTTSPIFYQTDISRLAKALRMRPADFMEKYLRVDEDNDYVLKLSPCPFLGDDNYCSVYEDRPRACREYPHTDRKRMVQILDLTHRNTLVCPAVFEIVERLKKLSL